MALEMLTICMGCDGSLTPAGEAWICSYECTFCTECRDRMAGICPNRGGELVRRPTRAAKT